MTSELRIKVDRLSSHISRMLSPKVLIVDDDDTDLMMLEYAIRDLSKEALIDMEKTGEGALRAMKRTDYALVLIDLRMPVMDGLQLIANMGIRGITAPVCTVSGLDNGPLVLEAQKMGCVLHIRKAHVNEDLQKIFRVVR